MAPEMNEVKNWLEKADHDRVTAEAALEVVGVVRRLVEDRLSPGADAT